MTRGDKTYYYPSIELLEEHFKQCVLANMKGRGQAITLYIDLEPDSPTAVPSGSTPLTKLPPPVKTSPGTIDKKNDEPSNPSGKPGLVPAAARTKDDSPTRGSSRGGKLDPALDKTVPEKQAQSGSIATSDVVHQGVKASVQPVE
jgi:hypothetical protein